MSIKDPYTNTDVYIDFPSYPINLSKSYIDFYSNYIKDFLVENLFNKNNNMFNFDYYTKIKYRDLRNNYIFVVIINKQAAKDVISITSMYLPKKESFEFILRKLPNAEWEFYHYKNSLLYTEKSIMMHLKSIFKNKNIFLKKIVYQIKKYNYTYSM